MIKKIATYSVLPILVGFVFFLYGFSSDRNKRKKVKAIQVQFEEGDNHFLTHESVNKLLIQNNDSVKNQPKSSVDLHCLEEVVSSNPYVEKANVFLTLQGVLKTQVKQRKPIARIVSNTESFYVDAFGVKIPLSTNFSARVPLVQGVKSNEDIKELTQLVMFISKNDFLKKEIIGIQKNKFNEYAFKVRSGEYVIDFGKFKNIGVKFKKLKAFYNVSLADGTIKNYKNISIKYHNQVVCTKQEKDGKQ